MNYFTYILESESNGRLYIGQTNNLTDRLHRHNANESKSTANRGPWILLHYEQRMTRSEAVLLERQLKRLKNPKKVKQWIVGRQQSG